MTPQNKKQCSRQLQCEVPCSVGNVVNSSLFINSSLPSLPSTSHAACYLWEGGGVWPRGIWIGGSGWVGGSGWGGVWLGGRGHFSPAAIYCITTWCFALKGLRTTTATTRQGKEAWRSMCGEQRASQWNGQTSRGNSLQQRPRLKRPRRRDVRRGNHARSKGADPWILDPS